MSIAQNLYNLRTARGLTQKELSEAMDNQISQAAIGLYESGARTPRKKYLQMLADFFDVPLSYFFLDNNPTDNELTYYIISRMHTDREFRTLFDISRKMESADLAPINAILMAITKEREG